jgi:hypothetical protein
MNKELLLKRVAPCGLVCFTCAAAKDGIIQQHGRELLKYLESFDLYAEKLSVYEERLKRYPEFKEMLQLFGEADCDGCRDGVCKLPGCGVAPCIKEKGRDFCFECSSFPCDKADFEPLLKAKWLKANARMKEIGAEGYFEEVRDRSHYA